MAAKSKPKEYSRAEGAALLRKQLAERKGKKIGMPSKENKKIIQRLQRNVKALFLKPLQTAPVALLAQQVSQSA